MKSLTSSIEDYLEAIFVLENEGKKVKSITIAAMLSVSRPAVSKAMNELREKDYIEKEHYTEIILTEKGREIAKKVYDKHLLLKDFLLILDVDEKTAEIDCCKIEHVVSEKTLNKIIEFVVREKAHKLENKD